jgi:hypothetical protein
MQHGLAFVCVAEQAMGRFVSQTCSVVNVCCDVLRCDCDVM